MTHYGRFSFCFVAVLLTGVLFRSSKWRSLLAYVHAPGLHYRGLLGHGLWRCALIAIVGRLDLDPGQVENRARSAGARGRRIRAQGQSPCLGSDLHVPRYSASAGASARGGAISRTVQPGDPALSQSESCSEATSQFGYGQYRQETRGRDRWRGSSAERFALHCNRFLVQKPSTGPSSAASPECLRKSRACSRASLTRTANAEVQLRLHSANAFDWFRLSAATAASAAGPSEQSQGNCCGLSSWTDFALSPFCRRQSRVRDRSELRTAGTASATPPGASSFRAGAEAHNSLFVGSERELAKSRDVRETQRAPEVIRVLNVTPADGVEFSRSASD